MARNFVLFELGLFDDDLFGTDLFEEIASDVSAGGGIPLAFLLPSEPETRPADQNPIKTRSKPGQNPASAATAATPATGQVTAPTAPSLTQALVARFIDQQARQALPVTVSMDLSVLAVVPMADIAAEQAAAQRHRDDDALRLLLLLT